jgi:hypothetical protein
LVIKTFNLKDKIKIEKTVGKSFSLISIISDLTAENRKISFVIVEASLISGLIGFVIGYFLFKNRKKKDMVSGETICPLCKEKFLRKTYKTKDDV